MEAAGESVIKPRQKWYARGTSSLETRQQYQRHNYQKGGGVASDARWDELQVASREMEGRVIVPETVH